MTAATAVRSPAAERFAITFPPDALARDQDHEAFDFADPRGRRRRLRLHDYGEIYRVSGLYEALVYDTLGCRSPRRVVGMLAKALRENDVDPADRRVLDLGAGNGIVGMRLRQAGFGRVVGLDLLPEAAAAAARDRPDAYDDYVVADLTALRPETEQRLRRERFDVLVTVAALGFGDIPPRAFATAFDLVTTGGWIAMTIKEDFLRLASDKSGFAGILRTMLEDDIIDVFDRERYVHRVAIDGEPLHYVAIAARKRSAIPADLLDEADDVDDRR